MPFCSSSGCSGQFYCCNGRTVTRAGCDCWPAAAGAACWLLLLIGGCLRNALAMPMDLSIEPGIFESILAVVIILVGLVHLYAISLYM